MQLELSAEQPLPGLATRNAISTFYHSTDHSPSPLLHLPGLISNQGLSESLRLLSGHPPVTFLANMGITTYLPPPLPPAFPIWVNEGLKGLVTCCHSFCVFYLFLTLHCHQYCVWWSWWLITCNGDLLGNGDFHDVVMANLLGSGGLQRSQKSSNRIDPFPPWDSDLRPTHQRL